MKKKQKVFVGLSGGVDSAVSAALLQKDGYDVTGVFIRIALPGYPCSAGQDKIEAMRAAAHLNIPFESIDLSKEYEQEIFNTSIAEFAKGRTPNPDALCNRDIKFGAFFAYAMSRGADFIATGHYARVTKGKVLVGKDPEKDQSYFLWAVPEQQLAKTFFPVGSLQKSEVRKLAKKFGLPNAARKDSQGLCFLGDISIDDMLARELASALGDVLDENGAVVGKHRGVVHYTLGQRHGFELFAQTSETMPHFIIAKDVEKNTITVSTSRFPKDASDTRITLIATNWIGRVPDGECEARFRYRQKLISARLENIDKNNGEAIVILNEPHFVPEGQSLVLYRGDRCLGGGIVDTVELL
jgi:tRNA-specific 2-thiouridylase